MREYGKKQTHQTAKDANHIMFDTHGVVRFIMPSISRL
jgi:hypothetical protein